MSMRKNQGEERAFQMTPQLILLALVLCVVLLVRIRLLQAPLERDEGEYAYMAQLLLKGVPPYLQAYTMKLPGVSFAYAFIMTAFGQTPSGIHLGLILVSGINAFFVYLLAQRTLGKDAAVASCASFAVLSVSQSVLGVFAHATHFVVLFALGGLLLLLRYLDGRRAALLFGSGICFGLAFTMKQHAALWAVFAFLYLLRRLFKEHGPGRLTLTAGTLFLAGAVTPYALIALGLALAGVFDRFWFWTVLYAREYAAGPTLSLGWEIFRTQISAVSHPQLPLWTLAGIGCLSLLTGRMRGAERVFLLGFLVFSFLSVCPGLYFREHYFVLLLPALSLLIGAAITSCSQLLSGWQPEGVGRIFPFVLLTAALGFGMYQERAFFFSLSPEVQVSRAVYGTNPFPEAIPVARYLKEHTGSGDRIAVLGSEPEICFYADRLSASGHIYMYGLMEDQPYAERMQKETIREVEAARPKYLVVTNVEFSWLASPASSRTLFDWVAPYLAERYEPVAATDVFDPSEPGYLLDVLRIYKRKV